jgi:hypothetical protein
MIEAKGCKLLPPYSPDFNLIEFSSSVIKNLYKPRGNETPVKFANLIQDAGMSAITPGIARNQFRHCHIVE